MMTKQDSYQLLLGLLLIIASISYANAYTAIKKLDTLEHSVIACTPENIRELAPTDNLSIITIKQNSSLCMRATITFDEAKTHQALVIKMLAARKVYWDEQLIVEDGIVGESAQTTTPGPIRSITPLSNEQLLKGEHTLTIALANFHIGEPVTTSIYDIYLTDTAKAYTKSLYQTFTPTLMIGALLIITLFFQAIYWLYQRNSSYLIFSLMCFAASMLIFAEHFRAWYAYPYPWHIIRLQLIIALTFISLMLLNWFYWCFYAFDKTKRFLTIIAILLAIALMIDPRYDAKSILMFLFSMVSCLCINILAYRKGKPYAKLGCGLFAVVIIILALSPLSVFYSFIEQWFIVIHMAIVLSIMASLIAQMQHQRRQAITAARLELDLLKRNLQPHFLMNSLTLIIEWIEIKPAAAVKFVDALAQNLRDLVRFSTEAQINLADEINLCRQHLILMGYRYDCSYHLKVNGQYNGITIAPAIILTQIENAFAHNRMPADSEFLLNIDINNNQVTIELQSIYQTNKRKSNNNNHTGTGEKYIHARLHELYGNNYQYQSYPQNQQWINRIHFNKSQEKRK